MYSSNKLKVKIQYQILLVPALILYSLFVVFPFLHTFYFSITNYSKYHIADYKIIGLKNYISVFQIDMLTTALINSIKYALIMTFFQSLLAIPIAVMLNRKMKIGNLLRASFFLPAMFSTLIVGFLWNAMMSPTEFGLINRFIQSIGLEKIKFFDADIALYSVILTQVWQWTGWAVVIYLANLQTISDDYIEAAKIDGATGLQIFFRIIFPLLNPAVTVVTISSLIGGLKVFDIIYSMTTGGPGYATETIMTAMIKKGFTEGNYALASAFGVIFFIIVMTFSTILLRVLKKWEENIT